MHSPAEQFPFGFHGDSTDTGRLTWHQRKIDRLFAGSKSLRLSFKVPYHTAFGHSLRVVGSHDTLGNWTPTNGRAMDWTPNDLWTVEFDCMME